MSHGKFLLAAQVHEPTKGVIYFEQGGRFGGPSTVIAKNIELERAKVLCDQLNEVLLAEAVPVVALKPKEVSRPDLELVYALYPRKEGKLQGLLYLERTIKRREQLGLLRQAVEDFCLRTKVQGTEPQFVPHFSTWVRRWPDYIPETVTIEVRRETKSLIEEFLAQTPNT